MEHRRRRPHQVRPLDAARRPPRRPFRPGRAAPARAGQVVPGEPLPRWAIGVHWRTDGEALWTDRSLLADPSSPGTATAADAAALAEAIATGLGIETERLQPAYEDRLDQLVREARLPGDAPPSSPTPTRTTPPARCREPRRADGRARRRRGRGEPAGWALPLHRADGEDRWRSGRWTLRRGRLILLPGDSPMGFRLPLASLTWLLPLAAPRSRAVPVRQSPAAADPVGARRLGRNRWCRRSSRPRRPHHRRRSTGHGPVREVRDGHPRVFLPPVPSADHASSSSGDRAGGRERSACRSSSRATRSRATIACAR